VKDHDRKYCGWMARSFGNSWTKKTGVVDLRIFRKLVLRGELAGKKEFQFVKDVCTAISDSTPKNWREVASQCLQKIGGLVKEKLDMQEEAKIALESLKQLAMEKAEIAEKLDKETKAKEKVEIQKNQVVEKLEAMALEKEKMKSKAKKAAAECSKLKRKNELLEGACPPKKRHRALTEKAESNLLAKKDSQISQLTKKNNELRMEVKNLKQRVREEERRRIEADGGPKLEDVVNKVPFIT